MNIFLHIIRTLKYKYAITNSTRFICYLRKKGIQIGDDCFFQSPKTAVVDTTRPLLVEVGNHCYFLENFTLLTHDNVAKVFGPLKQDFIPSSGKVVIGNNVYFTRNCTVLKGVTIGDNCIIGYGSTVLKSIPANSVVAGTPAKVICSVDEYYERRKKESLNEAFDLVKTIYNRTGKRPTVEQMWEEFPFWLDGNKDDNRLRFSVKYQTRGFNDYWQKYHKAQFESFDDFIDAALKS